MQLDYLDYLEVNTNMAFFAAYVVCRHVLRTGNVVKSLKGGSTAASGQFGGRY